jgi:hypothetical protein
MKKRERTEKKTESLTARIMTPEMSCAMINGERRQ